ncbi:MAG: RNA polymerase sigma factor [Gammaproteobacteria bacterium]|nr:RNA polymerase sigma factor [Gammaproteobacteria bacterium]MBL7001040.1 RNA polymerase sigma factor [Gammaproteobacteria bacterium]
MFKNRARHKKLSKQLCEHRNRFYKLAYSWSGDRMLADDLVQDATQKALTSFDSLKDDTKLKAWTCQIMLNCYRDWLRRKKDTVDIEDLNLLSQSDPHLELSSSDTTQFVRHCIQQLNENHRNVITLVDLMEFSYEEVSLTLEIPVGTVMSRLCRGRAQLKQLLAQRNEPQASAANHGLRRVK